MKREISGLYGVIDTTYVGGQCPPYKVDGKAIERVASDMLEAGVRIIQLRGKFVGSKEFLDYAGIIREETLKRNSLFIINDRVDIAVIVDADGVHLGHEDLPVNEARLLLKDKIIGFSTHNLKEVEGAEHKAKEHFIDYISFGPVFPTMTKKDARPAVGLSVLREAVKKTSLPIVAIGGITEDNMADVIGTGVKAVAIISDILTSNDVRSKTANIVSKMEDR